MSSRSIGVEPTRAARLRPSGRALILLAIVFGILVLAVAPLRGYLGQRAKLADLRRQAAGLERQNAALDRRIAQLSDPTYLEHLARECLGMVKPGETAFVVVPARGSPRPSGC